MKYKCGHKSQTIIMSSGVLAMNAYIDWMDSTGFDGSKKQCFDCYLKKDKVSVK